ncbi:MAG: agmatinase [Leptotrichiaceae bacterium]|jgi:agmatinase|nr:agmatinase [Leptotrichiaceae bacterium]MBP6168225.1 agmatinase [Leptotrichiaceae bacterium]MBP7025796.1 agmatinase [Leptotrichiaceae bacterium]MBP8637117.1 agmatinase [Leptotrichiaceae bacterium]MBP9538647.1 agmatinase [Leptotrichiaceae bacterium]
MKNRNIHTFIGCDNEYDESNIVVFGAPFDSTTSFRPGTRFASAVMRNESFGIETFSPYQDKDLEDLSVFDGGDLELSFGDSNSALNDIETYVGKVLSDSKVPFMIGGEHSVTLGAVRAVAKKYPDLHIVQFDAHTDLREDYLGQVYSHASVIRRCWDIVGDNKIFQFGIRSGEKVEFEWAKEHVHTTRFNFDGLDEIIEKLKGKPVYFTLDLDVLDPSEFPGTGTPESGGVTFVELHNAIRKLSVLNIVGLDMNELSPIYDQSGQSTALACKLLREILLFLNK